MSLDHQNPPEKTVRHWLQARADKGGTAVVFPETGEELGWAGLNNAALSVARDLADRGAVKGDSIAIMHPNGPDGVLALYACLVGGFRATMINLAAGPDAISYALDHSEAKFAFVHPDQMGLFDATSNPTLNAIELATTGGQGQLCDLGPDDEALLMYTSGTTGTPKGVLHTHKSLLAGGWTTSIAHQLNTTDRGFCVLPIYHINGLCVTVIGTLVSGGSLAMVSKFSASRFWDQVDRSGATWFSVVPTIISHLLHGKVEITNAIRSRVRFGRSASSALAVETQSAFETRFGIPIVETMGLTETAAQILSNPLERSRQKIGSPGLAFGNQVRIAGSDQTPAPPGVEGEIQVSGPNVMVGYLKNETASRESFSGNWLRTGDLGKMDSDGFVFVTGRLKELIIKGGENIAPREIDEALYTHPDVIEAAAFARPCAQYGERVMAAVRLAQGSTATERDLIELCQDRVGKFKSPDQVFILDDLPKGPSGKIQRLKLDGLVSA